MFVNKTLIQQAKELHLKRRLSQNFLINENILAKIAQSAQVEDKSVPIIEIGAGAGFLTRYLLETGHPVTAIEIDPRMQHVLESSYGNMPEFKLINDDVRKVDLNKLLQPKGIIVGNLPYHLTGPILFQIAGELADPDYPTRQSMIHALLMIQKEVGERLIASTGDKAYSQLTLQIQYWFDVTPVTDVLKTSFYPSPKVDSMVVKLTPRKQPAFPVKDISLLSLIIKKGFMHRRKTLYNNLKISSVISPEQLQSVLPSQGISMQNRSQELTLQQFGALSDAITNLRQGQG